MTSAEQLNVVLQRVKPKNEFIQVRVQQDRAAGNRSRPGTEKEPPESPSLVLMLTLLRSCRAFLVLEASLHVSILALKWGREAQEMSLAVATSPHSSKCSPNEYFSKLAIFTLLLAGRINCVARFSLVALIHNTISIGDI